MDRATRRHGRSCKATHHVDARLGLKHVGEVDDVGVVQRLEHANLHLFALACACAFVSVSSVVWSS